MRGDCAPAALRTCARGSVLRGSVRGSPRPRVSPRVCRGGWGALRERGAGTRGSVCVRGSACPYPWVATRVRTPRGGGGGGGGALRDRGAGTPRDVASAASVGPCPWVPTAARVHPVKSPQTSGVGHRGNEWHRVDAAGRGGRRGTRVDVGGWSDPIGAVGRRWGGGWTDAVGTERSPREGDTSGCGGGTPTTPRCVPHARPRRGQRRYGFWGGYVHPSVPPPPRSHPSDTRGVPQPTVPHSRVTAPRGPHGDPPRALLLLLLLHSRRR